MDNLDESGRFEFHGTVITMTSHLTHDNLGENPPPLRLDHTEGAEIHLPDEFATVPYIDGFAGDIIIKSSVKWNEAVAQPREQEFMPEEEWLKHLYKVVVNKKGELQERPVTYSGFFSYNQPAEEVRPRASVGIFPIFYEKASTVGMQKHAMQVSMKASTFVNPGQVPVIVADCPLYALQKKCQWIFADEVGESKIVCFLGLLHVEMATQECGGKI